MQKKKRAVALLGIDLIAHETAVGGQLDGADGLPSVIHAVVEGFLLGPGGAGAAQQKRGKRQDKRGILHKKEFSDAQDTKKGTESLALSNPFATFAKECTARTNIGGGACYNFPES